MKFHRLALVASSLAAFLLPAYSAEKSACFAIHVVDDQTGRGVPLVKLETVNNVAWWTDSAGVVAFDEPGLMGQEVFFHVSSPGYEYPKDGFDNRGVKLRPVPGGRAKVKLKRAQIAERLYRITGGGIYRDSVLAGERAPLKQPLLNAQVFGQDTVIATPYRGKIYWFWGDTDRASYPLGNFGTSGATSEVPGRGGLAPGLGVDLNYFTDKTGFSKPMCQGNGFDEGLQWIEGVVTIQDERGQERLVTRVASGAGLDRTRAWHLALFNDQKQQFESIQRWDIHDVHDSAHPFHARVEGVQYIYLYPNYRVRAVLDALRDLKNYEAFSCIAGDGNLRGAETQIERDAAGLALYSWKPGADRLNAGRLRQLSRAGTLKPSDCWLQMHDIETGAPVEAGRGSVFWNGYRHRWIMIFSAKAGEIWFSEADAPTGPWVYACRVATHGRYNFYNPTQHPFFDEEGGRVIYFEGTYTASFSDAPAKTPRYDYNQLMYRLALDDPRLTLPAPVYLVRQTNGTTRYLMREGVEKERAWKQVEAIAYFAMPPGQRKAGLVPIYSADGGTSLQTNAPARSSQPLFFARANSAGQESQSEFTLTENGQTLGRVWKNPSTVTISESVNQDNQ
jgi:hypothetical protein